jgi:hypothetical protein
MILGRAMSSAEPCIEASSAPTVVTESAVHWYPSGCLFNSVSIARASLGALVAVSEEGKGEVLIVILTSLKSFQQYNYTINEMNSNGQWGLTSSKGAISTFPSTTESSSFIQKTLT